MTATEAPNVLLLGPASAGKTTLLVQLHGRLGRGDGVLRSRGAPKTLEPIEAGLARLQQGLPVEHTPKGTEVELDLPAATGSGDPFDIRLPEYAGEDLETVMRERRLPEQWRNLASKSDRWLLILRPSQQPALLDVINKPIGLLAQGTNEEGQLDALPLDMWAVELLQTLIYARRLGGVAGDPPTLGIIISCWDELDVPPGTTPSAVAAERLSLLSSFARATWPPSGLTIYGLSAQGQPLDRDRPNEDFLDQGPGAMGWVVLPDGKNTSDLTVLACP